jgi:hypothetical protein
MVVEKSNEYGRPCWIAALDLKKAFDSISQRSIWNALEQQGVSHTYVTILQKLYEGQRATVQTDVKSRMFGIFRGTKQGDPISPILFNSVVESFMRRLKDRWTTKGFGVQLGTLPSSTLTNLRFADDILLIGRTLPQIRKMISDVASESGKIGLEPHAGKTKILHNNVGYGSRVTRTTCNGMEIEVLDCQGGAMYLGRSLRLTAMNDEELLNRKTKSWAKFGIYKNELMDKNIPIKDRLKLFDAVVTPTMLYGSGCWAMTTERQRDLRTTQLRMMRMILGTRRKYVGDHETVETYVEWIQRATRELEIMMDKYGVKDWVALQRVRLWKWAGRVARANDGRWSHEILHWEPLGCRLRGRPRARWVDQIIEYLQWKNLDAVEWMTLAANDKTWEAMWNVQRSAEPY